MLEVQYQGRVQKIEKYKGMKVEDIKKLINQQGTKDQLICCQGSYVLPDEKNIKQLSAIKVYDYKSLLVQRSSNIETVKIYSSFLLIQNLPFRWNDPQQANELVNNIDSKILRLLHKSNFDQDFLLTDKLLSILNLQLNDYDFSWVVTLLGKLDFPFFNLDLRYKNIIQADFSRCNIYNCDFRGAILTYANFEDAQIVNCQFNYQIQSFMNYQRKEQQLKLQNITALESQDQFFITGNSEGKFSVYDNYTQQLILCFQMDGFINNITIIKQKIIVLLNYNKLEIKDYVSFQTIKEIQFNDIIRFIEPLWNDNWIAISKSDSLLYIFNIEQNQFIYKCEGHCQIINCGKWLKNQNVIATGSDDTSIIVWQDFQPLKVLLYHKSGVNCIESSQNYIISGDSSGFITVWDTFTFEVIFQSRKYRLSIRYLSYIKECDQIAVGCSHCKIYIFCLKQFQHIATPFNFNREIIGVEQWNQQLVGIGGDSSVQVLNLNNPHYFVIRTSIIKIVKQCYIGEKIYIQVSNGNISIIKANSESLHFISTFKEHAIKLDNWTGILMTQYGTLWNFYDVITMKLLQQMNSFEHNGKFWITNQAKHIVIELQNEHNLLIFVNIFDQGKQFDFEHQSYYYWIMTVNQFSNKIYCLSNGKGKQLFIYDLDYGCMVQKYKLHVGKVQKLKSTNELLIAVLDTKEISIFTLGNLEQVRLIQPVSDYQQIIVSNFSSKIILLQKLNLSKSITIVNLFDGQIEHQIPLIHQSSQSIFFDKYLDTFLYVDNKGMVIIDRLTNIKRISQRDISQLGFSIVSSNRYIINLGQLLFQWNADTIQSSVINLKEPKYLSRRLFYDYLYIQQLQSNGLIGCLRLRDDNPIIKILDYPVTRASKVIGISTCGNYCIFQTGFGANIILRRNKNDEFTQCFRSKHQAEHIEVLKQGEFVFIQLENKDCFIVTMQDQTEVLYLPSSKFISHDGNNNVFIQHKDELQLVDLNLMIVHQLQFSANNIHCLYFKEKLLYIGTDTHLVIWDTETLTQLNQYQTNTLAQIKDGLVTLDVSGNIGYWRHTSKSTLTLLRLSSVLN